MEDLQKKREISAPSRPWAGRGPPGAEALKDEYFHFAWLLRHDAFLRFGYDPDAVFSETVDEFGFVEQGRTKVPQVNLLDSRAHRTYDGTWYIYDVCHSL